MRRYAVALIVAVAMFIAPALFAAPAFAQPPDPAPVQDRGSVLIAYNLADLEPGVPDRSAGFSVEGDVRIPGTVLSIVGHVSKTAPVSFGGIGPRITHDLGPFAVFGHYLFGNLSAGAVATAGLDAKRGGGIEIPLGHRAVVRVGADHDGMTLYSIVGVGVRF